LQGLEKTNWWGIALAFISGAFFTLSSAAVKYLREVDPMELLLIRSSVQCLVVLPIALRRNGCSPAAFFGPKGHRGLLQLQVSTVPFIALKNRTHGLLGNLGVEKRKLPRHPCIHPNTVAGLTNLTNQRTPPGMNCRVVY